VIVWVVTRCNDVVLEDHLKFTARRHNSEDHDLVTNSVFKKLFQRN
jgi:hypothetical protein